MSTGQLRWVEVFADNPQDPVAQTMDFGGRRYWKLQEWIPLLGGHHWGKWLDVPIEHNPGPGIEVKTPSPPAPRSPEEHKPGNYPGAKPDTDPPQGNKGGPPPGPTAQ